MPALNDASLRALRRRQRRATAALAASDPVLARLIEAAGPCRLEPARDRPPWQHLARAIAHQQLNGNAAATILSRFVALYGDAGSFPTPGQLLATPVATLRGCGFSASKVAALQDLARHALDGVVPDTATLDALDDEAIVARLTVIRGIGRWTVEMLLMFQLGRPDVLPVDDFGVREGLRLAYGLRQQPAPRVLSQWGVRWAPWRSIAAWYLWRAVDLARAGKLPPPPRPAPRLPRLRRTRRVRR
ncbi:MAG: DNA-3-methyladenine glycosylase 2 family protein [Steroidobacteraceae bacterium]